jgi:hypothetical protein
VSDPFPHLFTHNRPTQKYSTPHSVEEHIIISAEKRVVALLLAGVHLYPAFDPFIDDVTLLIIWSPCKDDYLLFCYSYYKLDPTYSTELLKELVFLVV